MAKEEEGYARLEAQGPPALSGPVLSVLLGSAAGDLAPDGFHRPESGDFTPIGSGPGGFSSATGDQH